ncbi:MAG: gfo/Idh/MocA family oxidoreductase [Candidatus Latescibacterota bacterium]|nr:MAG: gfo/Idh/MocA family oxidoreductase [Candidatus Latescibacterota bacterium]
MEAEFSFDKEGKEGNVEREIGFGVVGLGMGVHHTQAIHDAQGARLVAVCDINEERLNRVASQYGVKAYSSYEELLSDPEVEVVNICTPSGTHADMGVKAVKAGKHILVEKPPDVTVEKVDQLIDAVRRAGVKAGVTFQSRTFPLNRRIKAVVEEGRLGKLIGVNAWLPWWRAQSYYSGTWKGTWALDGGGSLMNQGVHTVDLLQWIAGPVRSVMGRYGVFAHDIEAEDTTVAVLNFACGAVGTLMTTTCAYPGLPQMVLFYGENGSILKEENTLKVWRIRGEREEEEEREMLRLYGPQKEEGPTTASDPMAVGSAGHQGLVEDMVRAIREDREPYITLESARHAVEIINAIYESSRTGREVFL